jgi:hypothetical protein
MEDKFTIDLVKLVYIKQVTNNFDKFMKLFHSEFNFPSEYFLTYAHFASSINFNQRTHLGESAKNIFERLLLFYCFEKKNIFVTCFD